MTTKNDFSADEWALVYNTPTAAAGTVMAADQHVLDVVKETLAVAKAGDRAREKYKDNAIVLETIPRPRMKDEPIVAAPKSPYLGLDQDGCVAKIREACELVARKATPAEAAQYKEYILELCDVAANASGEGFMGTGPKVSEKEAAFLAKLKAALG